MDRESILWIVNKKEYAAINVKDICQKADLSRQTFYQIFDSKDEVICYCIQQRFLTLHHLPDSLDLEYLASHFAQHIEQNRDFIKLLGKRNLGHFLTKELSAALTVIANRFHPGQDEKAKKLTNAFLTAGLSNMLLVWSQDDSISEENFVSLLYTLCEVLRKLCF